MHSCVIKRLWILLVVALVTNLLPQTSFAQLRAERLLVVYNENFSGSEELAREYAKKRGVPERLVLGIKAPTDFMISRDQYIDTIREPIDFHLRRLGLVERAQTRVEIQGVNRNLIITTKCDIDGILLSYGFPQTISNDGSMIDETLPQHLQNTAAAVDSELTTLLTLGLNPTGPLPNPFFKSETRFKHGDPTRTLLILLVARLDGPTLEMTRERLHQAWETEKSGGLNGLGLFDARGLDENAVKIGDQWIENSAKLFRRAGFKARLDTTPEMFPESANFRDVIFYLGWYSQDPRGLFLNPQFRFSPGAVAYHLHSFSAQNIRTETQFWVGPLIAKGAAATFGHVLEPFLGFIPHLDIFTDRILKGWTFAEAVYASQPALSWMLTVIGDPLYVPFPTAPIAKEAEAKGQKNKKEPEADKRPEPFEQRPAVRGRATEEKR